MSDSNFLTVGGQTSFDMPLAFRAQAAVINNLSNQWVQLPDANDTFVPPYIVNMIVPVGGATRFRGLFAAPTGITQAATISGQRVTVDVFETALTPGAGQLFPVRAPSTEWRNALSFDFAYDSTDAPGNFVLWSYTCPAGRRARVEMMQVLTEIATAYTGTGNIETVIHYKTAAQVAGNFSLTARIAIGAVIGARADAALSAAFEMTAGDRIQGQEFDPRVGGTSLHYATAKVTEGDA